MKRTWYVSHHNTQRSIINQIKTSKERQHENGAQFHFQTQCNT